MLQMDPKYTAVACGGFHVIATSHGGGVSQDMRAALMAPRILSPFLHGSDVRILVAGTGSMSAVSEGSKGKAPRRLYQRPLYGHKIILAHRCEVLREMIETEEERQRRG